MVGKLKECMLHTPKHCTDAHTSTLNTTCAKNIAVSLPRNEHSIQYSQVQGTHSLSKYPEMQIANEEKSDSLIQTVRDCISHTPYLPVGCVIGYISSCMAIWGPPMSRAIRHTAAAKHPPALSPPTASCAGSPPRRPAFSCAHLVAA